MRPSTKLKRFLDRLRGHSIFLTPAGAGIAVICFFLPWVRVSCGTVTVEASGARIGGIFWAVFAVAIAIFVTFFFFWKIRRLLKIKLPVIIGAVFSITILFYKFFDAFGRNAADINLSDLGGAVRYGAVGEVLGFLAVIVGIIFNDERNKNGKRKSPRRLTQWLSLRRPEKESEIPPKIP